MSHVPGQNFQDCFMVACLPRMPYPLSFVYALLRAHAVVFDVSNSPPLVDIAVDPLDGTTLAAQGGPGAMAVIALAERGSLFDPGWEQQRASRSFQTVNADPDMLQRPLATRTTQCVSFVGCVGLHCSDFWWVLNRREAALC